MRTTNMHSIDRLRMVRNAAEEIRDQSGGGRITDLAQAVANLAEIMLADRGDEPDLPVAGANPSPEDRTHGVNVAVGQVIEHSRLLDACAPDVVIRNGGDDYVHYFRRTRQKRGGVGRKWQPCTATGEIKPLSAWPDGFDSDQVFLPATVVKLPTQVIR